MVGAQLAVMSGEAREERVDKTALVEHHAELGAMTRTLAILVFIAAVAYAVRVGRDRLPGPLRMVGRARTPRAAGIAVAAVLLISGLMTTVWAVRAGHAGAKATWRDLPATHESPRGDERERGEGQEHDESRAVREAHAVRK